MRQSWKKNEWLILYGSLLGLLIGFTLPGPAQAISFIGDIFLMLLKVILIPFICVSIFLAFSRMEHSQELKILSRNTFVYYFITSTLACVVGLIMAHLWLPTDILSLPLPETSLTTEQINNLSFDQFILSFFTNNIFMALSESRILPIVVFMILIGLASLKLESNKRQSLNLLVESINDVLITVMGWIIKVAPLGVLSLIATTLSQTDFTIFQNLGAFFLATTSAVIIHSCISLPLIYIYITKKNPWRFFQQMKQVLLIALSTASSSATLPISIKTLEDEAHVSPKVAGFVTPLGATLNMDGSALYQSLVIIFLAHMSGADPSIGQQLFIFLFVMISSAGTAGIPGGGIVMVGLTLETIGVPLEYIGFYLLVDRFWDYPITAVNVWGDLIGVKVIAHRMKL